ncbi:MAG: hypothetical protein ACRCS3_15855, partial [Paracoccaceae bacterium]
MTTVLILGSGPNATIAQSWPRASFDHILAINNAWQVRADWDALIHPHDFPPHRWPVPVGAQQIITEDAFVPAQNAYGGFVYAGGTMAFTAAYWALHAHRPRVIAVMGCDMHYPAGRTTHFYGMGTADPLRADVTLQSLEAKAARLMVLAAMQGCAVVNLSMVGPTRLVFPRVGIGALGRVCVQGYDRIAVAEALACEAELGYL